MFEKVREVRADCLEVPAGLQMEVWKWTEIFHSAEFHLFLASDSNDVTQDLLSFQTFWVEMKSVLQLRRSESVQKSTDRADMVIDEDCHVFLALKGACEPADGEPETGEKGQRDDDAR